MENTGNQINESTYYVLVVEDELPMQKLLITSFIKMGIEVIIAQNIKEANELIMEDSDSKFGLVIIDINKEVKSVLEFCDEIRQTKNNCQLPILIISANSNAQLISSCFDIGCNDFIKLPYNSSEFNHKVKLLIETKKLTDTKKQLQNLIEIRTQVFKMNTHDLKNPLSSIFSLSGIPVDSFSGNEEISQTLDVIHNASKIMMSLVNSNLEFLTISSETIQLEKEPVDVISLINQIVEMNNPLAKKKHQKILYNYPKTDCIIISDHNKIYQAINNIVGNAIKFSPFDKRIWIDITKDNIEGKVKIIIADEGPGFKKEEIDTVLVKFGKHSATPTGDEISTGLGLLITKQIINLSHGDIYLESEEGKGSKFTIEFDAEDGVPYGYNS